MENRTVQDFVEDLVSDCRDLAYILAVAANTRWKNQIEEIKKAYRELKIERARNEQRKRKKFGNNHKEQSHQDF